MAHISGISAGVFSDIAVSALSTELTASQLAALDTAAEFEALFASEIQNIGGTVGADTFTRIKNIREFPMIGQPANIVNVPVYGQGQSSQVNAQADAPDLSLTLNYIPAEFDPSTLLGGMVGDGVQRVFRMSLLGTEPTSFASTTAGIGQVQNSSTYWIGRLESLVVSPQLTDANQATLAMTIQGRFNGAYTLASA